MNEKILIFFLLQKMSIQMNKTWIDDGEHFFVLKHTFLHQKF